MVKMRRSICKNNRQDNAWDESRRPSTGHFSASHLDHKTPKSYKALEIRNNRNKKIAKTQKEGAEPCFIGKAQGTLIFLRRPKRATN